MSKHFRKKNKPLKKRSFSSFFFRIWMPMMLLTILVLYGFFSLFSSYMADSTMRMQESQFNIYLNSTINEVNDAFLNESISSIKPDSAGYFKVNEQAQYDAKIQFRLGMTGSFGPASIYEIKNNEYTEIMNSLERYYLAIQVKNQDRFYFSCDKIVFDQLLQEASIDEKSIESGDVFINLHDFYVKDDKFLPGTFDLYDNGTYSLGFGESEPLDYSFNNYKGTYTYNNYVPIQYDHVEVNDDVSIILSPILLGSKQTPEELWKEINDKYPAHYIGLFEDRIASDTKFDIYYGDIGGFITYNLGWNSFKQTLYGGEYSYTPSGNASFYKRNIRAVSVGYFNVLDRYGYLFLIISGVSVLLITMMCIIITLPIYRDYRERYLLEQYRKKMTDNLAHDLKSPLMAISGYAETLKLNVLPDKTDYYLDSIIQTSSYMNEILSDMFELDSLEGDREKMKQEIVSLDKITASVVRRYENNIQKKELKVRVEGVATMTGDSYYMRRVVDNLINNAIKYTPKGNSITIKMNDKMFMVENTGVTIPKDRIAKLCEPFVKGDKERSNQSGSGLGLSIVRNILALHNTDLVIESANDITQFSFHLN